MNGDQIVLENFTTPNYVNNAIQSAVATITGYVNEVTAGSGLCSIPSTIIDTGVINLDADLNDLNDVSQNTPALNQVLTWDGNCWCPKTFSGSGSSPFNFIDVEGTPSQYIDNYLLQSTSDSITFIPNNYINSIANGPGIGTPTYLANNQVRLNVDLTTYSEGFNMEANDEFTVLPENSDVPFRIKQNNITIDNFSNSTSFVQNVITDTLTATYPIFIDGNSIGLSGSVMTGIDFTKSITGILPISHGGTSSSTSFEARINLGLSYNTDILYFQNPEYRGFMNGTNIRFAPETGSVEVKTISAGQGYNNSNNPYVLYQNNPLSINVITGTNGEICSAYLKNDSYNTLLYTSDFLEVEQNTPQPTATGYVKIIPDISYINFGLSQREEGIGFRDNNGQIEYRNYQATSWLELKDFNYTLTGLNDVNFGVSAENNVLVYENGKYNSVVLTGQVLIENQKFTVTGPVNPIVIDTGETFKITNTEFATLNGISSNIQQQLNQKITSSNTPSDGSIIYYQSSSGSSTVWQSLGIGSEDEVLTVVTDPGTSPVGWKNPFESIGSSMIPKTDSRYDIGTSLKKWSYTYTDVLNLTPYTYSDAPEGINGSIAVFSDGNYGNPCLSLYWGSSWLIIGTSGNIDPGP